MRLRTAFRTMMLAAAGLILIAAGCNCKNSYHSSRCKLYFETEPDIKQNRKVFRYRRHLLTMHQEISIFLLKETKSMLCRKVTYSKTRWMS